MGVPAGFVLDTNPDSAPAQPQGGPPAGFVPVDAAPPIDSVVKVQKQPIPADLGEADNAALAAATRQYPALGRVAPNVTVVKSPLPAEDQQLPPGDRRQLESYPPWEEESPLPGRHVVQVFSPGTDAQTGNLVAGDLLHYFGGKDPRTGQPVDPTFYALKQRLIASRTPAQQHADEEAYKRQAPLYGGNPPPFDDWLQTSRGDEYLMGFLTPDQANEWKNVYTPQQRRLLTTMQGYLRNSRSVPDQNDPQSVSVPVLPPITDNPANFPVPTVNTPIPVSEILPPKLPQKIVRSLPTDAELGIAPATAIPGRLGMRQPVPTSGDIGRTNQSLGALSGSAPAAAGKNLIKGFTTTLTGAARAPDILESAARVGDLNLMNQIADGDPSVQIQAVKIDGKPGYRIITATNPNQPAFYTRPGEDLYDFIANPGRRAGIIANYARLMNPENKPVTQALDKADQAIEAALPTTERENQSFLTGTLPQGVGSTGAFALTAPLGVGAVAVTGAASQAQQGFQDAIQSGASLENAFKASGYNAIVGTSEAVPIEHFLSRLDRLSGGTIRKIVVDAVKSGTEEATQEAFQQISQNAIAHNLYDQNRDLFEGAGQNAAAGAGSGALLAFLGGLVHARVHQAPSRANFRADVTAAAARPTPEITPPPGPPPGFVMDIAPSAPTGSGTQGSPAVVNTPEDVNRAAAVVNTAPTEGQKAAGNYQKGHIDYQGLPITIESPAGSTRSGTDPNGQPWSVQMPNHYGYIKRTGGADGEHVDVTVGPHPDAHRVFVIDQVDPATGQFDEHKTFVGFDNAEEAMISYMASFSDGSGPKRAGAVSEFDMPAFKDWLQNGDTTKPLGDISRTNITNPDETLQEGDEQPITPPPAPQPITPAERSATGNPDHAPVDVGHGLQMISAADIGIDPKRFQFKANTNERGENGTLQDVQKWDPNKADIVTVWQDKEGRNWVVDGHQRVNLAQRLDPNTPVLARVLKETDGITAKDAMVMGAVKNIAQGTGSSIDAAKIARQLGNNHPEIMALPPRSALVRDARSLAALGDQAFGMVANGLVDPAHAAIVGRIIQGDQQQVAALKTLIDADPRNASEAQAIVDQIRASGFHQSEQQGLFGPEGSASTLIVERGKVLAAAIKELRRYKDVFTSILKNTGVVTGAGNILDNRRNLDEAQQHAQALATVSRLANSKGPIADALNAAARDVKAGKSVAQAGRQFATAVRQIIENGQHGADGSGSRGENQGQAGPADLVEQAQAKQPVAQPSDFKIGSRGTPGERQDITGEISAHWKKSAGIQHHIETAENYLMAHEAKHGTEASVVFNSETGELTGATTSNEEGTTAISRSAYEIDDQRRDLVIVHNHPEPTNLSGSDIMMLLNPRIVQIVAVMKGGGFSSATSGPLLDQYRKRFVDYLSRDAKSSAQNMLTRLRAAMDIQSQYIQSETTDIFLAHGAAIAKSTFWYIRSQVWSRAGLANVTGTHALPEALTQAERAHVEKIITDSAERLTRVDSDLARAAGVTDGTDRPADVVRPGTGPSEVSRQLAANAANGPDQGGARQRSTSAAGSQEAAEPKLFSEPDDWKDTSPEAQSSLYLSGQSSQATQLGQNMAQASPTTLAILNQKHVGLLARVKAGATKAALKAQVDSWRQYWQDNLLKLRRIQEEIEKLGTSIPDWQDAYKWAEGVSSRVFGKMMTFHTRFYKPLVEQTAALVKKGVPIDQIERYLYARHAEEANQYIASIDPNKPDGGSGMSTADARQILADAHNGPHGADLQAIGNLIDSMNRWKLSEALSYGLIDLPLKQTLESRWKHWVALRTAPDMFVESGMPQTGQGFSVGGREWRSRTGRHTEAEDILSRTLAGVEETILRGERNRVGQALAKLVKANPAPGFWDVDRVTYSRKLVTNPATGQQQVALVRNPGIFSHDEAREIHYKENGKTHSIWIDDPRLMRNLKNQDIQNRHWIINALAWVNRKLSALNTSYYADFAVTNMLGDYQEAMINAGKTGHPNTNKWRLAVTRDYLKALAGVWGGIEGADQKTWQKHFQDFVRDGGKVSFYQLDDVYDRAKKFEREVAHQQGISGGKIWTQAWHLLERGNQSIDNAIRLAAYVHAKEQLGMTGQQAASFARNLTVNFNRRGEMGPIANALYLFFNASVQGARTTLNALRSKHVRRVAYGLIAMGALQELLWTAFAPPDDDGESKYDKINEDLKARNIILPVMTNGTIDYVKLPISRSYNVFWTMGRTAMAYMLGKYGGGQKGAMGFAKDNISALSSAFNPFDANSAANAAAPTIADPFVDLARNQDYFGRRIYPERTESQKFTPNAMMSYPSDSEISRWTAQMLQQQLGIDVYPGALDYLMSEYTGGAGRQLLTLQNDLVKVATGKADELGSRDVPVLRRIIGTLPRRQGVDLLYDRATEVNKAAYDYSQLTDESAKSQFREDHPELALKRSVQLATEKLAKQRKALNKPENQTAEARQEIYQQMDQIVNDFNKAYVDQVLLPERQQSSLLWRALKGTGGQ